MQETPAGGPRDQILALAGLAGNRATGQLLSRLRADGLPEHGGVDIAPLLAAQVPELLPFIPADEIGAMQQRFDTRASNAVMDERVNAKRTEMRGRYIDPDSGSDISRGELAKVKGSFQAEEGPLSFHVKTENVLSDDILLEPPKNKAAEMKFRHWMRDELLKAPTVTVTIKANPRAGYQIEADRRAHPDAEPATTEETAVLISGGRYLPHTKGKVHFQDLVEHTFKKEYYDQVTNSEDLIALKRAVIEIQGGVGELEIEHKDRIEKNKEHPVVRRIAEALGGPDLTEYAEFLMDVKKHPEKGTLEERQDEMSTDCPELGIWFEPKTAANFAMERLQNQELEIGLLAYMRAEAAFDRAAHRYQRYEQRVMKGAGIAVKWLERAKMAGKLAAGTLAGGSVLAGALVAGGYSFVQEGAQQASEVAYGQRRNMDWKGLTKGAAAEGAMALFGGVTQGAFTKALEAQVVERWGAEALKSGGTRLMIGGTAAAASSFYNVGANLAVQKIIYGHANMPRSLDELANMVLDEASTAVITDAGMQGVHHTFEPSAHGQVGEAEHAGREQGIPEHGTEAERLAGPAVEASPGSAAPHEGKAAPRPEPHVVDLISKIHTDPAAADVLIDHFGSWESAIEHVVTGKGDMSAVDAFQRGRLLHDLISRRVKTADDVAGKFGGKTDPATAADPAKPAEVTMEGQEAGLKVAQANVYLDSAHPGWQSRYKLGLAVDGARAKTLTEAMSTLPQPMQEQLAHRQATLAEAAKVARDARGAATADERASILSKTPESVRTVVDELMKMTPETVSQSRIEWMTQADRSFQKIDPQAAPEIRMEQIKQAITDQGLADAIESMPLGPPPQATTAESRRIEMNPADSKFPPPGSAGTVGSAPARAGSSPATAPTATPTAQDPSGGSGGSSPGSDVPTVDRGEGPLPPILGPAMPHDPRELTPRAAAPDRRPEREGATGPDALFVPEPGAEPTRPEPTLEDASSTYRPATESEKPAKLKGAAGSNKLEIMVDAKGEIWLFKPASGEINLLFGPNIGIEQHQRYRRAKAAEFISGYLGIATPEVRLVKFGDRVGSLQRYHGEYDSGAFIQKYKSTEAYDKFWNSQARRDMDAMDFVLANQDRHDGNWMIRADGQEPVLMTIDQDSGIPVDPVRGYRSQEPQFTRLNKPGDQQFWARDLPPGISRELATNLRQMLYGFPENTLRQWLTQPEVDGIRSRLGALIQKIDSGEIKVLP